MAMTSLNISLPAALKKYVTKQVASGDWGTPSEYIRGLIRQDKEQVLRGRGGAGDGAAPHAAARMTKRRSRRSMGKSGLEVMKEVMAERRRAEEELGGE
jgi:antitoxin ParD1/3/4